MEFEKFYFYYFLLYSILKSKIEKIKLYEKKHMIYEIDLKFYADSKYEIKFEIRLIFFEI